MLVFLGWCNIVLYLSVYYVLILALVVGGYFVACDWFRVNCMIGFVFVGVAFGFEFCLLGGWWFDGCWCLLRCDCLGWAVWGLLLWWVLRVCLGWPF